MDVLVKQTQFTPFSCGLRSAKVIQPNRAIVFETFRSVSVRHSTTSFKLAQLSTLAAPKEEMDLGGADRSQLEWSKLRRWGVGLPTRLFVRHLRNCLYASAPGCPRSPLSYSPPLYLLVARPYLLPIPFSPLFSSLWSLPPRFKGGSKTLAAFYHHDTTATSGANRADPRQSTIVAWGPSLWAPP